MHRGFLPISRGNVLLCEAETMLSSGCSLSLVSYSIFGCKVAMGRAWSKVPSSAHPLGHLWHRVLLLQSGKCWEPKRLTGKNLDKVSNRTNFSSKACLTGLISQSFDENVFQNKPLSL